MGRTLNLRRTVDGMRLIGEAPEEHGFSARFIARGVETGDLQVIVVIPLGGEDSEEELVYRLTGFEQLEGTDDGEGNPRVNPAAWQVELVGEDEE